MEGYTIDMLGLVLTLWNALTTRWRSFAQYPTHGEQQQLQTHGVMDCALDSYKYHKCINKFARHQSFSEAQKQPVCSSIIAFSLSILPPVLSLIMGMKHLHQNITNQGSLAVLRLGGHLFTL